MKLFVCTLVFFLMCRPISSQFNFGNQRQNCGCTAEMLANCPALPLRGCEVIRRLPCGCCNECALRRRATCNSFTPPCGRNLLCVHNNGTVAKKYIGWNEFDFVGTCRFLVF